MYNIFEHYAEGERLYELIVEPVCRKHSLTFTEFTVLMFLANNPQYDTAAQIVRFRHLAKSHVSISVRSLEEKGLIIGKHHEPDRRTIHLKITAAAADIVADGREAQNEFREVLHSGFSNSEYDMLAQFMRRIDQNIANYTNQANYKNYK